MDSTTSSPRQLALLALGVVFGDIGTSPLYAFRTALAISPEMTSEANVLGILSLLIWALVVVVCIKYVTIVLNADNRGEGGVLVLSTLVLAGRVTVGRAVLGGLGMLGAALFFADGAITPAISVLSAVEGVSVSRPELQPVVVPATVIILVLLFRIQSRGTSKIGGLFGPVMIAWFGVMALLGVVEIARYPAVLLALDPTRAIWFVTHNGQFSLAVISAVFLAVTGGEALFADLGHFGKLPIRIAWYVVVLPALLLNYMGQGALVLSDPAAAANPFFLLGPSWALPVLVLLATAATVIASQAVISGAFSVVHQAVRLSYVPRLEVRHSSAQSFGQVFVPMANATLAIATVLLVLGFQSSEALAGAYGIAIALAMAIESVLILYWLLQRDSTVNRALFAVMVLILLVDLVFCFGNLQKLDDGGWVPAVMAAAIFVIMNTWTRGRVVVADQIGRERHSVHDLRQRLASNPPARPPGTAVFLASNPDGIPRALWHNLQYNNALHQNVILLSMLTEEIPRVPAYRRLEYSEVLPGITRVIARFGFMETPVVNDILYEASREGVPYKLADAIFFVGSESLFFGRSLLRGWEKRLFAFLMRNSRRAASFYSVPETRLVEFGTRLGV
jgi:KUP system potassium uptake protein